MKLAVYFLEPVEQKHDPSTIILDGFKVTLPKGLEIGPRQKVSLSPANFVHIEATGSDGVEEILMNSHFQHLDSERSRRGCISLLRVAGDNVSVGEFTYNDLVDEKVLLSVSID